MVELPGTNLPRLPALPNATPEPPRPGPWLDEARTAQVVLDMWDTDRAWAIAFWDVARKYFASLK